MCAQASQVLTTWDLQRRPELDIRPLPDSGILIHIQEMPGLLDKSRVLNRQVCTEHHNDRVFYLEFSLECYNTTFKNLTAVQPSKVGAA
jgi:hypothetical protein